MRSGGGRSRATEKLIEFLLLSFRSSLLGDRESEDDSLFGRMHRHTSLIKDNDLDDPTQRFPSLHRLR